MRTPYGKECTYYYQDFGRGREIQECRLLGQSGGWKPDDCKECPVPGILMANACPDMVIRGKVVTGLLGMGRRVRVTAYCRRSNRTGFDPHIGCGECHKDLDSILPPK
jgi:hypothetical protein